MSKDLMDVEEDVSALKAKPLFLDEEDDFNPVGLQERSRRQCGELVGGRRVGIHAAVVAS
jgi:hypothetical protein